MSLFDKERLTNETFKLDIQRMRRGWYSDKYFNNIGWMLTKLTEEGYTYRGKRNNLPEGVSSAEIDVGNMEVEMQWFTRRSGATLVVGVDKALEMLRHCTGTWDGDEFIESWQNLQVWAVQDGDLVHYNGNPTKVQPVIKVRGRYRDFSLLETPTLGILARASRIATNVYRTLIAANGKPVLFFPARFDLHEVQAADGYAYDIAVQRFNLDYAKKLPSFISTDAQGDWWGGAGGGTVAHAALACFLGDTAEAMLAFSRTLSTEISRIALVDFNNDSIADSLSTCKAMFLEYQRLMNEGKPEEAERYRLFGVRLDTSGNLRDVCVPPLGDPALDLGVTPRLVFNVRQALDSAWENWNLPKSTREAAREYCQAVKIVVSGGFNPEKIRRFEHLHIPVDIYGVGSSLFDYHGETVTDFTADVVRVKLHGEWVDMAKIGRAPSNNPDLKQVW